MLDLGAIVAYNAFLHFHSHPPGIPSERVLLNLKQKKYWLHITLQSSIILEFRPVAKGFKNYKWLKDVSTPIFSIFDLLTPLLVGVALFLAIMATASRVEEGRQNTGVKIMFLNAYNLSNLFL